MNILKYIFGICDNIIYPTSHNQNRYKGIMNILKYIFGICDNIIYPTSMTLCVYAVIKINTRK
jgi:hypothetical protein